MMQHRHEMLMAKVGAETKRVDAARNYKDKGYSFTRRCIALASIGAIIVLPIVAGIIDPTVPVSYGYAMSGEQGLLMFSNPVEGLKWATGTGIVLTPMHTHLVAAIAGLYFGASSVK